MEALENLYFNTRTSADTLAHQAIICLIGHQKLMYGHKHSWLPLSREIRGL